jgi:hypothetical protein
MRTSMYIVHANVRTAPPLPIVNKKLAFINFIYYKIHIVIYLNFDCMDLSHESH